MPSKTKIIYVVTKSVWGGAQRYTVECATALPPEEFEVVVAAGGSGALFEKLEGTGVRAVALRSLERTIGVLRELAALRELTLLFMAERPEIIHLSSSKAGGIGAVAARLAGLATRKRALVVFTVHGWAFKEPRTVPARAAIAAISWLSTLFHDRVITISSSDWRSARRFIPQSKLAFIPNGIRPPAFLPRPVARRELAALAGRTIGPDTLLIGAIAELAPNKQISSLLRAAAMLKRNQRDRDLCIIVIGEGAQRRRLQSERSTLGLDATAFLPGFVPDAARLLKGMDLFALPSRKEGLPYALLEAMCAGLPIVASRVGGIPDLIIDGASGRLVEARNPQVLAAAIAELAMRPDLTRGFAREALVRAAQFPFSSMISQTLALYRHGAASPA